MQIDSKMVGRKLKDFRVEISRRQTTNYAAAVSDPNPVYFDDQRDGGIIAPPTLAAAVTWPIIQNIYEYIDLNYSPEILLRMVHYSEQLIFYRPLRPGDVLSITGEVAAVLPTGKGTHIIFKFPAIDSKGEMVFTEYIGGALRGVSCGDGGRGAESIPAVPQASPQQALSWEASIPITREAPYLYDGCAGVVFGIHTSPAFARSVGLPDIIYQGVATLAHAVRELVNREAGANPTVVRALACRFRGMVLPDSFIRVQLLQRAEDVVEKKLFFRVLNQEGREAVSEGYMLLEKNIERGRF
ncbi:MAG: MaoC/PaaZ C-terminal domain-containing protein [Bacillota bacterium]